MWAHCGTPTGDNLLSPRICPPHSKSLAKAAALKLCHIILSCYTFVQRSGITSFSIQVTCREYEHELSAQDPTSDAQLQHVRQLHHRQLQVPLAEAAQTMQSYLKWEASLPDAQQPIQAPSHVQQGFQKAQQAVSLRREHEAMVAPDKPADENLLAAFLAYIKYEEVGCSASTS
jgi:hypothetical protein